MKSELKVKFLQHLNEKNREEGFTLIELLVVVIIIGILAAVALPSLLSQTNKARQAEARQNVGAINRAQQAYFLEASTFATGATAMESLGVGIATQTDNFTYSMAQGDVSQVVNSGLPSGNNSGKLKAYGGVVYSTTVGTEALTQAFLCESTALGQDTAMTYGNDESCGNNYTKIGS